MVYKIFVQLKKDTSRAIYTPVMTKIVDEEGNIQHIEFATDDTERLEEKLLEVIKVYGSDSVRVVTDVNYVLDATFGNKKCACVTCS